MIDWENIRLVVMFQLISNMDEEEWPEVAGVFDNEKQANLWIEVHQELYPNKFKYHIEQMWIVPR